MTDQALEIKAKTNPAPKTESSDEQDLRRWLRRWLTSTLRVPPQNLQIAQDGSASIQQLVAIAKPDAHGAGYDSVGVTSDVLMRAILSGQGGFITKDGRVRLASSGAAKASKTEKPLSESALVQQAATAEVMKARERQLKLDAMRRRTEEAQADRLRRAQVASNERFAASESKKKTQMSVAMKDLNNERRIADPKDHSKLATILPSSRLTKR